MFGFNQLFSFVCSFIGVHDLVKEWVHHFFLGGGAPKTLPQEGVEEARPLLNKTIRDLLVRPSWEKVGVAQAAPDGAGWYKSLLGVIGSYNYRMTPTEGGVKVSAWDRWDFNSELDVQIELPIPSSRARKMIKAAARHFGLEISEHDDRLVVLESDLARLNPGREFITTWEDFIPWEDILPEGASPEDFNWEKGGLPYQYIWGNGLVSYCKENLSPYYSQAHWEYRHSDGRVYSPFHPEGVTPKTLSRQIRLKFFG